MTDPTTPPLAIPDEAGRLTFACGCSESGIRTGYLPESIPLIIAAELRRLAALVIADDTVDDIVDLLDARVAELGPGGRAVTPADTPPAVDHRAEAEKHLTYAIQVSGAEDNADELVHLQYALVHATLAAGTPVADQHVGEALAEARQSRHRVLGELRDLREAVRAYLGAPHGSDLEGWAIERLRELTS